MGDFADQMEHTTTNNNHKKRAITSNGVSNIQDKYNNQWTQTEENHPVPKNVPSILELKKILPRHCFLPDLKTSLYFVLKDLGFVLALYTSMRLVEMQPFWVFLHIFRPIYWFLQGTMFWALFVLGHDCGHGSFSKHDIINDVMGTILHTMIYVPFYPWKLSHRHHHKNTGNIDKDEVFYPTRKSEHVTGRPPILPLFGLGLGWWGYLLTGYAPRTLNHFNPTDWLFKGHVFGCTCSILALLTWTLALMKYTATYGFYTLLCHYVVPVFVFGSWLVMVTFLHHTELHVPWYCDEKWDNVRGQLSSVDRDYGWAHHLTHHIGTHQIHHLFIKIPHYHLEEATAAFRKNYPHLVRICNEPILSSFVRMFNIFHRQHLINDDTKVHWFNFIKQA